MKHLSTPSNPKPGFSDVFTTCEVTAKISCYFQDISLKKIKVSTFKSMLLLCLAAALGRRTLEQKQRWHITFSATDHRTASSDGVCQCSFTSLWGTTGSFTPVERQNVGRSTFCQSPLPLVSRKEGVWPYIPLAKSTLQSKQNSSDILLSHWPSLFLGTKHYLGCANAMLSFHFCDVDMSGSVHALTTTLWLQLEKL